MSENRPSTELAKPKNAPPRRKKLRKAACWIAVFTAGLAAGGLLYGVYSRPPDPPLNYPAIEEKLTGIQRIIADNFLFPVDRGSLENGIYHGLLDGLNDPYSVYFTPDEFAALKQEYAANYCGIGAEIHMDGTSNPKLRIIYDDSPALRAGLRVGDLILKVDGVSAAGMTLETLAREHIMGEPGTEVSLEVYRPETGQTLLLTAVRAPIVAKTVESRMLADSTGYLRVQDFYDTTADEFIEQCGQLEQQGMQRLIIDLRGNPGGSLDAVVRMLDYILPDEEPRFSRALGKATIVCTQTKNGDTDTYLAGDGHALEIPIKLLVNRESASASEVLSGCLRDYGLAELVGETTFGKGIVQSLFELDEGDAVKLTVSQYYTPSGFGLHGVGLSADARLPVPTLSEAGGVTDPADDPWVQSALDLFDRQPVLEPLSTEKNPGIAPPQRLTEALPDGFSCKEAHLKLREQDLTSLLAAFTQSANRQIKLRVDHWFTQEGSLGQPPFSHDLTYEFWTDTPEEIAFITFSYDLDGESLHAVECDMLDPMQSVELAALVLEFVGEPLPENGREAILEALEQGKPYKLKGKHSTLELREYDGSSDFYLLITAS